MTKTSSLYLQHRQTVANYINKQDSQQLSQKQQDEYIKNMAMQPGQHTGNQHRRITANAMLQLFVLLSSVKNIDAVLTAVDEKKTNVLHEKIGQLNHRSVRSTINTDNSKVGAYRAALLPNEIYNIATNNYPVNVLQNRNDLRLMQEKKHTMINGSSAGVIHPQAIKELYNDTINRAFFKQLTGINIANNGNAVSPVILFFPEQHEKIKIRTKRIAQNISEQIQDDESNSYITTNCHIRTKTIQGTTVGDSLLVSGEYIRNPIRAAAENIYKSETGGGEMPDWLVTFTESTNIAYDVMLGVLTFGAYPIIKYASAKGLKSTGHVVNGDNACLKNEFSPEEMANLLFDTEVGITDRRGVTDMINVANIKSAELNHAVEFKPDGLFIHENMGSRINTAKYIKIHHQGNDYFVKEKLPGEYYTFQADGINTNHAGKRVYFDNVNNKIHFNQDMPAGEGLDYTVVNGKNFIEIRGNMYELIYNQERKRPKIVIKKKSASTTYIPVYMEPLSKTWHTRWQNNHYVFNNEQRKIISSLCEPINDNYHYILSENNNPRYYGHGKIYRAEMKGDNSHFTWEQYIEINAKLVPVRQRVIPGHGDFYEMYNKALPGKPGFPIEWDGHRWLFNRETSMHVSNKLKRIIDPGMHEKNIDVSQLSAADSYGLRWDEQQKAFLKVNNHYVKVTKLNDNRYAIAATANNRRVILRFKDNKFVPETMRERLANLRKVGLNGRKRKHAIDILKEQDGFNEKSAKALLAEYRFPSEGLYSDYTFALEIEQTGKVPIWSEQFKKTAAYYAKKSVITDTISVLNPTLPGHKIKFHLGDELGEGANGQVFLDADDTHYVIKKYFYDQFTNPDSMIMQEADNFKRYYGEDSAQVLQDEKGAFYLRMYRVPGQSIESLDENSLPSDAIERFVDMLEKLNGVGILHGDLHTGNVLWDAESATFYPIDIDNVKSSYFKINAETKQTENETNEVYWFFLINEIKEKMVTKAQSNTLKQHSKSR